MFLNCGVREDSWESLRLQGHPNSPSSRKSVLNIHWKDWCWSRNSNTLATWCEEPTHWKRPWCWKKLKAGGERDDRGWDGWMASLTQRTWVWQAPGDGEGQGILACCSLWGCKGSNTTEWLNWTELPLWANYLPKIPHLLILSYWELVFNIWILGRYKPSVCSTSTSCFPFLWITKN